MYFCRPNTRKKFMSSCNIIELILLFMSTGIISILTYMYVKYVFTLVPGLVENGSLDTENNRQ